MEEMIPVTFPKFKTMGTSGLNRMGESIYEETERKLQGSAGIKNYREMKDNDGIVSSLVFSIHMMLKQAKWSVKPASKKARDKEYAAFVEECRNDMDESWSTYLDQWCSFLEEGFCVAEINYKKRNGYDPLRPSTSSSYNDGRVGWKSIAPRDQLSIISGGWKYDDETGELTHVHQKTFTPPMTDVYIPMTKCLHFKTTASKGSPQGRSILRSAWRAYYFKRNIENLEGITIERDGAGLPVIMCPPELFNPDAKPAYKELLSKLTEIVQNIRVDDQAGIVMPQAYDQNGKPLYELKLLSTGGTRSNDTNKVIQRYSAEIAMSTLADFILLGHTERGTQALAREKSDLFLTAIKSWLDVIADQFNKFAIPRLMKMNGWPVENSPKLVYGDISKHDVTSFVNNLRNLTASGMEVFPDAEVENFVRAKLEMPLLDEKKVKEQEDKARKAHERYMTDQEMAKPGAAGSQDVVGSPNASPSRRKGRTPKTVDVYDNVSDS